MFSKWCKSVEIIIQSLYDTLSVWRVWQWLKLEHGTKWMVQTLSSELEPKMWFNSGANTNSFWHAIPRINPISSSSLAWGEKVSHAMRKFGNKLVARECLADDCSKYELVVHHINGRYESSTNEGHVQYKQERMQQRWLYVGQESVSFRSECDMLSSILQWQSTYIWRWPMTRVFHDTLINWHTISMLVI